MLLHPTVGFSKYLLHCAGAVVAGNRLVEATAQPSRGLYWEGRRPRRPLYLIRTGPVELDRVEIFLGERF
ncbi:MAG TPA: hypothetical protein PL064_02985 [Thermogutta sp.]|nr:hypothetical protein [Thermogutta sp.]